jgi:hypothetical protein
MFKKCSKCKELKSVDVFNKNKSRKDGYDCYCRDCRQILAKLYYKSGNYIDIHKKYRQTDKWKQYHKKYRQTDKYKQSRNRCHKIWVNNNKDLVKSYQKKNSINQRSKHPEKYQARVLFNHFKNYHNIKPQPCQLCSNINRPHFHHIDYSKPLIGFWLCMLCHKKVHLNNNIINHLSPVDYS